MGDRDLTWVRNDPAASVRREAAWADYHAHRNMAWARKDPDVSVRQVAGILKETDHE
jgi:hypothetical protein